MPKVRTYDRTVQPAAMPAPERQRQPIPQMETPLIRAVPSPESRGAGVGTALMQAGAVVGQEWQKQRAVARAQQDQVAVLEAERQLGDWELNYLHHPKEGVLNTQGKHAFGIPEEAIAQFDKTYDGLSEGLSNNEQKQAFMNRASGRRQNVYAQTVQHAAVEMSKFDTGETEAYIRTAQQTAVANASNATMVSTQKALIVEALDKWGARNGTPDLLLQQKKLEATSAMHVGVIDWLINHDQDQQAEKYFKAYGNEKEMTIGDLSSTIKVVKQGSLLGTSQRTTDFIWKGGGVGMVEKGNLDPYNRPILDNTTGKILPPGSDVSELTNYSTTSSISIGEEDSKGNEIEVVIPTVVNGKRLTEDEARDHYKKTGEHFGKFKSVEAAEVFAQQLHNRQARYIEEGTTTPTLPELFKQMQLIENPKERELVLQQLKDVHSLYRQQESDEQAATSRALTDKNRAQQQFWEDTRIDLKNKLNQGTPFSQVQKDPRYSKLTPDAQIQLESYANRNKEPGGVKTDYGTMRSLLQMSVREPARFIAEDLQKYSHLLSPADMEQLTRGQLAMEKDVRAGPKAFTDLLTIDQAVKQAFASAKLDPESEAGHAFFGELQKAVDAAEAGTGKKVTGSDVEKFAKDLLFEISQKPEGIWQSIFGAPKKRRFEYPPGERPPVPKPTAPAAPAPGPTAAPLQPLGPTDKNRLAYQMQRSANRRPPQVPADAIEWAQDPISGQIAFRRNGQQWQVLP